MPPPLRRKGLIRVGRVHSGQKIYYEELVTLPSPHLGGGEQARKAVGESG